MKKNKPENDSRGPVTLQVIADHAGVTRALVSMALHNSPKVAAATRERIQALARELGYRPNPMVRALMSEVRQRRKPSFQAKLGFVTNLETADCWLGKKGVYAEYFLGAQQRGRELGYEVEHFWLGEYRANPSRLSDILRARGIPGLLIPPLSQDDRAFEMDLSGFRVVAFGYSLKRPNIHRFCNHHVQTIQDAVEQLVRRGYRHIGIGLGKMEIEQVNYLWLAGLEVARRRFPGLKISFLNAKKVERGPFQKWIRRAKPEAVICLGYDTHAWLLELGLKTPEDMGYLHLDCRSDARISGMYQNTKRLGTAAVELLATLVEGSISPDDGKPRYVMVNSDFHEGSTLRPLPAGG